MTTQKELPVLPDQVSARVWIGSYWVEGNEMQYVYSEDGDGEPLYTDKQLQAYGQQCAAHAREMALEEAAHIAHNCIGPAPIIRNLMKAGK